MLESAVRCKRYMDHELAYKNGVCHHRPPYFYRTHSLCRLSFKITVVQMRSSILYPRISYCPCISRNWFKETTSTAPSSNHHRALYISSLESTARRRFQLHAALEVASAVDVINDLGLDTLTFLAVTVLIIPAFRYLKASPILGFFFAGVVLNQFGLIRNITDVKVLSEWGILFLLFEMGLELSLSRLKALAKFAFGMGLTQVLLSTLAFTAFELPPNGAIGTRILEFLFHSRPDLLILNRILHSDFERLQHAFLNQRSGVNIRSLDEAIIIGAALSLSSSAFVLQLLAEKGELPTRFGSATLGILLLQDIAVVPLLVILPVIESQNLVEESIWPMLLKESLKALGGLGLLSFGGKFFLRRIFEVVAETRSSEAFIALCLLTVAGTSLVTQKLGFSDTLGAFLAGTLLAETNFRTQIEADIRPFRGLLLGLFFVTTGTSIDMQLFSREWPNVLALLGGLISIKTMIITAIGPRVGLSLQESVRVGFLLSQGGEFAFVVFSLANRLGVLPLELNKLLIIVVVLSMALTPVLNDIGRKAAAFIDEKSDPDEVAAESLNFDVSEPVVILGFGQMGQVLANLLSAPLASGGEGDAVGWPYVAFDLNPAVVKAARKLGFPIYYGDGSRSSVLQSAGITSPKAVIVMYTGKKRTVEAVERIRLAYPAVPIYARAQDLSHLLELKKSGATDAILENAETSLQLGSKLLKGFGVMSDDVNFLSRLVLNSMEVQAREEYEKSDGRDDGIMKPLQVRVADLIGPRSSSPAQKRDSSPKSGQIKQEVKNSELKTLESDISDGKMEKENGIAESEDIQGGNGSPHHQYSSNQEAEISDLRSLESDVLHRNKEEDKGSAEREDIQRGNNSIHHQYSSKEEAETSVLKSLEADVLHWNMEEDDGSAKNEEIEEGDYSFHPQSKQETETSDLRGSESDVSHRNVEEENGSAENEAIQEGNNSLHRHYSSKGP